jgi:fructose-bisphosphate aldolase class I
MDGAVASHDIDTCYAVTDKVLQAVFAELALARVSLPGTILKPNMVIAGQKSPRQATPREVAEKTVKLLKARVPAEIAGIAFLSGGQSDEQATEHLSLMNAIGGLPWPLTYSYGRALQAAAIQAWEGKPEKVKAGQQAFTHRARMNSLASKGSWTAAAEKEAA